MTILAPIISRINLAMAELIARDEEVVASIGNYSFEGGGKRLRPLLFCLVSEALGRPLTPGVLATGAAFEFLHMATLLHDDIVDLAEVRRGRPAAHLVFGVPETVLTGDYLLAKAAGLGAEAESLECVKIMASVVATLSLGELSQLRSRRQVDLPEEEYFKIIYRKTAVLMEGAAKSAAVLTGSDDHRILAGAARYGRQVGLAFQIVDDILDYQSDEVTFGKPVGHDLDEGKITLPFILARAALGDRDRARLKELAERPDLSPADHEEIRGLVIGGGGIEASRLKVDGLVHEARVALDVFPPSPFRDHLAALADYAGSRDR